MAYARIQGQLGSRGAELPFVTTLPIYDLGLLFALLPVWWLLGIEQLILPVGLMAIALKLLLSRRLKHFVPTAKWLAAFLLVYVISAISIEEPFRWITYFRNLSTYISAFLLLIITTNVIRSWADVRYLLNKLVLFFFIAGLVGLVAVVGLWQESFPSLFGVFLPDWIKSTGYGERIAHRFVGYESWFLGASYFRVNSFFLFPTFYAAALAFFIPISLYLLGQAKHPIRRLYLLSVLVLVLVNLVFSTGRMAFVGTLVGATFFLFFFTRLSKLMLAVIFVTIIAGSTFFIISQEVPIDELLGSYEAFVYARGSGSFLSRTFIYEKTIEGVMARPWIGWGTERDIPGFHLPAGSHSYFLGTLYKQGVIGLLVFLGIWIALWRGTRPPHLRRALDDEQQALFKFLQYGRWALVAALVISVSDVIDLDAVTMAMMWLIFSLMISANLILRYRASADEAGSPASSTSMNVGFREAR